MALKVGELYGVLRLDGDQFDRQLDTSGKRFGTLGQVVTSGTKVMASAFTAATTAVVGIGVAALKVGLDYNRMQQSSRAALTTLLGSAEAANAQMDKLDEFAKSSPFAKQVFIQAQQQLIGFGVAAADVLPTLDAIQNAVAAVGGSNDDITELTRIIAQVQSSGKITAETLNQLGARGVDAATLIGSQMGKTGQQIRDDITDGALDAGEAIAALTDGMMERFGGATDNIKQQFDGAADRIKGAFRDIGSILATPFIDPKGGGRAVEWANALADAMRALEQKAKPAVDLLIQRFGPGLDRVTPALESAKSAINGFDLAKVNAQVNELTAYTPLIAGAATALFTLGGNSLGLAKLGLSLNPVVAGMAALVATSPDLRAAFLDLLTAAADLAGAWGEALAPAATALLQASLPLMETLADLVSWVSDLPQPVLTAGLAFAALHGPLSSLNAPVKAVGEAFVRFGQQAQVQAALGGTNAAMGGLAAASAQAGAGVRALGLAMKTAFLSNPVGLALVAVTTAVAAFATAQSQAQARADELTATLDEQSGALTQNSREWIYNRLEKEGALDQYRALGGSARDLVGYFMDEADAIDRVNGVMAENRETFRTSAGETTAFNKESRELAATLMMVEGEVDKVQSAERERIAATQDGTAATSAHTDALRANNDELRESANANISAREAQIRATESEREAAAAVAEGTRVTRDNTGAVDLNAASTVAADQALLTLARDYGTSSEAMRRNNASAGELNATIAAQRSRFIETATQMGYTKGEAIALANSYGLIPKNVTTDVTVNGISSAVSQFSQLKMLIDGIPRTVTVTGQARMEGLTRIPGMAEDGALYSGGVRQFADGGIDGAGNHVPRVPQIAQGGKYVMWAEAATGWEAYISGKPSMRSRNLAILDEAARRLGVMTVPMNTTAHADGVVTSRSAPQPGPAVGQPLTGMRITGTLDLGGGLTGFVDGRISAADNRKARVGRVR